jgi:hypothetical protein
MHLGAASAGHAARPVAVPRFSAGRSAHGALFEQFGRNFVAKEQRDYEASRREIEWDIERSLSRAGGQELLPAMGTDIGCARQQGYRRLQVLRRCVSSKFRPAKVHLRTFATSYSDLKNQTCRPGWEDAEGCCCIYNPDGI